MNKNLTEWIYRDLGLRELADALMGILGSKASLGDFCRYATTRLAFITSSSLFMVEKKMFLLVLHFYAAKILQTSAKETCFRFAECS